MKTTPTTFDKRFRVAGAAAAMALVFAACGSDDDSAEPAEAPAEEPAEAPAEEPAEAPAEEPAEAPAEEPAEAPAEEPAEEPAEAPADGPVAVAVVDFNYDPDPVEVAAGTTITWTNEDSFAHTVTNDGGDFEFDSGNFGEGETFEMTFDEAGEFAYICTIHNQMKATIVVS